MIAKSPNSNKNVARIGIIVAGSAQPIEGKQLAARKRQIERRLDKSKLGDCTQPVLTATNIHYEIGERVPRLPLPTPRPTTTLIRIGPLHYLLNGLGLAVREILGEVGFRELMQRGAKSGVFHLETR
jgi:hypothetical protein